MTELFVVFGAARRGLRQQRLGPVELPAGEHELFVDLGFSGSWDPSWITSRTYNADTWGLLEFRLPDGYLIVDTGSCALMLVLGAGVLEGVRRERRWMNVSPRRLSIAGASGSPASGTVILPSMVISEVPVAR